jgi:hypothetical protein
MNSDQIAKKDRAKDALYFYKKKFFFELSISKRGATLTTFCMPYVHRQRMCCLHEWLLAFALVLAA